VLDLRRFKWVLAYREVDESYGYRSLLQYLTSLCADTVARLLHDFDKRWQGFVEVCQTFSLRLLRS